MPPRWGLVPIDVSQCVTEMSPRWGAVDSYPTNFNSSYFCVHESCPESNTEPTFVCKPTHAFDFYFCHRCFLLFEETDEDGTFVGAEQAV